MCSLNYYVFLLSEFKGTGINQLTPQPPRIMILLKPRNIGQIVARIRLREGKRLSCVPVLDLSGPPGLIYWVGRASIWLYSPCHIYNHTKLGVFSVQQTGTRGMAFPAHSHFRLWPQLSEVGILYCALRDDNRSFSVSQVTTCSGKLSDKPNTDPTCNCCYFPRNNHWSWGYSGLCPETTSFH